MENQFQKYDQIKSNLIAGNKERVDEKYCFIIPTYKRPVLLKRALQSIYNQKEAPAYNVVVVDNDSDEGTETEVYMKGLAKEKNNLFYYKNEENIGMFGNWNRCYQLAKGEYCCILMDDDEVTEKYLARIDEIMGKEKIDCLRVGNLILDQNNQHILGKSYLERRYLNRPGHLERIQWKYFLFRAALPPSGMCVRKEVIYSLGGYNAEYWPASDFELDIRLVTQYKVRLLWEKLCITHTEDSASMTEEALKKSIEQGLFLYKKAYKDSLGEKGEKYNCIAEIRTWIGMEKNGYSLKDFDNIQLQTKYGKKIYKIIYKIAYRLFWIKQTFF